MLPFPGAGSFDRQQAAAGQAWYPAVGLLIGCLLAGADRLLADRLPLPTEAAVLLLLLEAASGLLHLDGLADSADGLLCTAGRERRLEIMRDSRSGSFGVAVIALYLLLCWSALAALDPAVRTAVLLLAPISGRSALVAISAAFPYARPTGLGSGFRAAARSLPGALAACSGVVLVLLVCGPAGLVPFGASLLGALAVGAFARRRLAGVTGDVMGAGCEVATVTVLVISSGMQSLSWFRPWW